MLFVQSLVVISEHKALRLHHLILILQDLIVVLEDFGLCVVDLFRQHKKLPNLELTGQSASSENGSRGVGRYVFQYAFPIIFILAQYKTSTAKLTVQDIS